MIQLAFKLLADFGPPVPARTSEMDLAAGGSVGVGVGVGVVPADRTVATSRALAPAYRPAVRGSSSSTSSTASTQTARKQRAFDALYLGSIPVTKSVGSAVVLRAVRTSDLYFWVNSRNLMEQSQHYIYIYAGSRAPHRCLLEVSALFRFIAFIEDVLDSDDSYHNILQ